MGPSRLLLVKVDGGHRDALADLDVLQELVPSVPYCFHSHWFECAVACSSRCEVIGRENAVAQGNAPVAHVRAPIRAKQCGARCFHTTLACHEDSGGLGEPRPSCSADTLPTSIDGAYEEAVKSSDRP